MTFTPMKMSAYAFGTEDIELRLSGTIDWLAVAKAKRNTITAREAANSNGKYLAGDSAWNIDRDALPEVLPPLGSRIRDSKQIIHTIQSVDDISYEIRVRVITRALSILAGLDTIVTIESVSYSKSGSGAAVPVWEMLAENVRAKITLLETLPSVENKAAFDRGNYSIVLQEDAPLGRAYRITDQAGKKYQINSFQPETIGSLATAQASIDPWPQA